MDEDEIRTVIQKGENEEVEFKENISNLQSISKVICSFSNTRGGVLFIGVKDNGMISGLDSDSDIIQQKISSITDVIYPSPILRIEEKWIDEKMVFIAIVQRPVENVYYTYKGAIYVRMGSTTRRLEGQSQLEFLRRKQILSFDENYSQEVKLHDIDEKKVQVYLESRGQNNFLKEKGLEEFLLSSKLAGTIPEFNIKNAAVLLFGKAPNYHFPQSELKLVRFSGNEPVSITDYQLIQDDVINTIEKSISFILRNIKKEIIIDGSSKRSENYEYPPEVIREAIVNAVVHRDYFSKDSIQASIFDDRIEITNPGSLPNDLERELFGTISIQRNQVLYHFLRDLGYVEGLGTGIPRMREKMRKMGLSDPDFLITQNFFRISLKNNTINEGIEEDIDLNERQRKAIEYLKENNKIKSDIYSKLCSVSIPTAVSDLNDLVEKRYLRKIGEYRGAYYELIH